MTRENSLPDRNNWPENSEVGPPLLREQVEEALLSPGTQIFSLESGKAVLTHEVGEDQRVHKVEEK